MAFGRRLPRRNYYKKKRYNKKYQKKKYNNNRRYKKYASRKFNPYHKEIKYYDQTAVGGGLSAYPTSWSRYDLSCGITQGDNAVSRDGDVIVARNIRITGVITRNAGGSAVQRVRYMLIDYPQSEGTIPTAGEIFQTTGVFRPQRNLNWINQFRILADKMIIIDSAVRNAYTITVNRKLFKRMRYQDNAGTTGSQVTHQLFFVIWSDQGANVPTLSDFAWRLTYSDV